MEGTPFIITADEKNYDVYRCSPDALPHGEDCIVQDIYTVNGNFRKVAKIDVAGHGNSFDLETAELKWSQNGLLATFVQYHHGYADCTKTLVCFWPVMSNHPPWMCENNVTSDMVLEGKVGSFLESMVSPWLVASCPSGRYAVVVLDRGADPMTDSTQRMCLQLLHFSKDPPRVQARELELPRIIIDLSQIYSIAMDERCGVIYMAHCQGYLFAIPYA